MDDLEIREADERDAEAIALLSGELGYPSSTGQVARRLESLMRRRDNAIFVATARDGSLVGWIHIFVTHLLEADPFAELGGFVVTANQRGRGVGKKMLAVAEGWGKRHGIERMRIRSRSTRLGAHAFYERLGYRIDKTQHVFEKRL
jgi:GNAT superfamily N-acetyltransferase